MATISLDGLTYKLKVSKRIQETSNAVSLVLEIPPEYQEKFKYTPGQFISFNLNINGENLRRSYSLSSAPSVDSNFQITVKSVPNGRGSNFLIDQVKEGDSLEVTPPAGIFFKPQQQPEKAQYLLFAAGSGITPVFSILKSVLNTNQDNHVHLIFCNRTENDIIYAKELLSLEDQFKGRLKVSHILSQPSNNWNSFSGRINETTIKSLWPLFEKSKLEKQAYLCGPEQFMQTITDSLVSLGLEKSAIHRESFATSTESKKQDINSEWTLIGDNKATSEAKSIEVVLNGEKFDIVCKDNNKTVLETLIDEGINAPYSCMDGACMACLAKVTTGLVYQEDAGILSEENIEDRETLTCQCRPLSSHTVINYDEI